MKEVIRVLDKEGKVMGQLEQEYDEKTCEREVLKKEGDIDG